MLNITNWR